MRSTIWSPQSQAALRDIFAYIETDNPAAAERIVRKLFSAGEALGRYPTGRPGKRAGTYEKVVTNLPYVIVYSLSETEITILRIVHTARNWR